MFSVHLGNKGKCNFILVSTLPSRVRVTMTQRGEESPVVVGLDSVLVSLEQRE